MIKTIPMIFLVAGVALNAAARDTAMPYQELPAVSPAVNTLPVPRSPATNEKGQTHKERVVDTIKEKKEAIDKAPPAKIDPDPINN